MLTRLHSASETPNEKLQRFRDNYLDLMQSCLTGSIYRDKPQTTFGLKTYDTYQRDHGLDWPAQAPTMIGTKRMANLRKLVESIISENVPGDFIETGVWRGGACIWMRAIIYAYGIRDRCVWAADSFAGLPMADSLTYPADADSDFHTYAELAVSLEEVENNFRAYGLLDDQVKFLKGWFKDTLPTVSAEQFSLIRLDGDMYESTMDALTNLYPKLSSRGYAIVDDYHLVAACRAAVHDYCDAHNLAPKIIDIDGVGVYWQKSEGTTCQSVSTELSKSRIAPDTQMLNLSEALVQLGQEVVAYLGQSLAGRDGDVERLAQLLESRDGDVARLTQLLAERDGDLAKLNEQLAAVYASTSWRMTEMLRSAGTVVKHDRRAQDKQYSQYLNTGDSSMNSGTWPELVWKDDFHLTIDGISFFLSVDSDELGKGKSSDDRFLLGKPRDIVDRSIAIWREKKIEKIFEMGILQGGSMVLYDQALRLTKMVGIDHEPRPVASLAAYIAKHGRSDAVKPYFGTSQADRIAMENLLSAEFPAKDIDLIIDDASHMYDETRAAFNISFPYLKKGGLYVIEDWAWAHWSGDYWQQELNPYLKGKTALSNLLIELFMLAASRPDFIRDIRVEHSVITVTKGDGDLPSGKFDIGDHYLLRGKRFGAWL